MWVGLGQAATVAQLAGADVGGLISMIMQAAVTAQQNKKECERLTRRVFMIAELLPHLQDPEVIRRPEVWRLLAGLDEALREAHELVTSCHCQEKSAVYRFVMAGRLADRFRDVERKIDSYLLVFPFISHIGITRRLDRIYKVLLPDDTILASPSADSSQSHALEIAEQMAFHGDDGGKVFTMAELAAATNNFSSDKQIGNGGFGRIYMGMLPDGREVAVKRKSVDSYPGEEEFMAEITILSQIRHKNIIRLLGWCRATEKRLFRKNKEERLIVYEYMENGSLDCRLHDPLSSSPVVTSWKTRMEILLGVSRAIEHLQSYGERPVIHRDIKPSNILLDDTWAPCLSDFGLSLTWDEAADHDTTPVYGTYGYIDPEYYIKGRLMPTNDMYNFGVVMLEVLTGKRAYFGEPKEGKERGKQYVFGRQCLASFAMPLIEAGELWKVLDRRPAEDPTPRQLQAVDLVAQTAALCLNLEGKNRPAISEVVANLETAVELVRCDG